MQGIPLFLYLIPLSFVFSPLCKRLLWHFYRYKRCAYQSVLLLFLPLNLESFAYRHLPVIPVHLHRKLNEKIHRVMKIKNIFFAAILVIIGFSCSAGEDTIMNDVERGVEEATEANAVLDFGIAFNEMATKGTDVQPGPDKEPTTDKDGGKEKKISDVSVFLLEGEKVIGVLRSTQDNDIVEVKGGYMLLKDLKFVTKYKKGRTLDAHVVVNGSQFMEDVNIGDSKSDLNQKISGCLSEDQLIKYGSKEIVFGEGKEVEKHFSSPSEAAANPTTIYVNLSHAAARLDFNEFSVKCVGFAKDPTVKFLEAKYVNINNEGTIFGTSSNETATGEVPLKIPASTSNKNTDENWIAFEWKNMATTYSYANTATALYVKFSVDGRVFEKTYPINPAGIQKAVDHDGIKAGHLYDIKVRWTITPKWGDSTIEFYTKDWVYNNLGEIVL